MRKNLLFVLLLMLFVIPLGVEAEEFYFNHGEYNYSTDFVEQTKELEVQEILGNDGILYKYRTRDYLIMPDRLIIYTRNFDILSTFDTNIPLEEIELIPQYDLEYMNHCYGNLKIIYKNTSISKSVYISIDNYLNIPKEIVVENIDFDIWNYIDTDIEDRENIEFIGEYDLSRNGEYEILINYNYISEKTKIIVNLAENNIIVDGEDKENEEDKANQGEEKTEVPIEENKGLDKIPQKEIVNNYFNNYELKEADKQIEYVEKLVPVTNKIICENSNKNDLFCYITYAFYGITIILLSIIVVRKK